jgi:hypothetical protein
MGTSELDSGDLRQILADPGRSWQILADPGDPGSRPRNREICAGEGFSAPELGNRVPEPGSWRNPVWDGLNPRSWRKQPLEGV